jgi:hypothetical protein
LFFLTLFGQINPAFACYQAEVFTFDCVQRLRRKEPWLANQQNDDNNDEKEANTASAYPDYTGAKWQ